MNTTDIVTEIRDLITSDYTEGVKRYKFYKLKNLPEILKLIDENPEVVIKTIAETSKEKAIKNTVIAILIIAVTWTKGYKKPIREHFNDIVKIPTDLFLFLYFLKILNGKVKVNSTLKKNNC